MKHYLNIKRMAIIFTSLFIIGFEYIRHEFLMHKLSHNVDLIFSSIVFIVAAIIFSHFIFKHISNIEEKRQQKEREAKALFDNSVDGIFVFDQNKNLVDMNHGAVKLSEWEMDESISSHTMDTLLQFKKSIDLHDLFSSAQSSVVEGVLIGKNREEIPISATFTLIPNERKDEEKIAVIVRDLTERNQMENIIKDLYNEASQKQLEAETQYRIAKRIASIRDFSMENDQPILQAVTKDIQKLLSAEYVALFLFNFEKENFDLIALTDDNNEQIIKSLFSQHMQEIKQKNEESSVPIKVRDETLFIPLQREDTLLGYLITGKQKEIMQSLQKQELVNSISNSLSIFFENWLMNLRLKDVAIIEERERLAREMHDGVSQEIISIQLRVQFLKHLIQEKDLDDPEVSDTINEITKIVNIAHHEVRHNLFNLRTNVLEDEPFVNSIKNYVETFGEQNNIRIEGTYCNHCYEKEMGLSDYTKMHIVRIIQEALSNARRHASASKIEINLQCNKKGTAV